MAAGSVALLHTRAQRFAQGQKPALQRQGAAAFHERAQDELGHGSVAAPRQRISQRFSGRSLCVRLALVEVDESELPQERRMVESLRPVPA